jgi:uncharacterized protein YcfJ
MKSIGYRGRAIAGATAAALSLGACQSPGGNGTDTRITGVAVGALTGCLIGKATGGDCATGAVLGGAAGFLIGWYFESKKVASAAQINNEYQRNGTRIPKQEVVPVAFASDFKQNTKTNGEREVKITSTTDMIGYGDKKPDVKQKYAIYDEKNTLVEEKTERIAAIDGPGRYQTNSSFSTGNEGKRYTVKTTLIADNKAYRERTYKVAFDQEGRMRIAEITPPVLAVSL